MFKKRNIEKPPQWAVFSPFFPMSCSPVADERRRGFIFLANFPQIFHFLHFSNNGSLIDKHGILNCSVL
jgi:hypothetical protein